jgi:hypothetical protein
MPIDDRTTNRNYQLPNAGNFLADDVARLRAALTAIDADVFARYTKTETDQKLADLINGAPGALDTLNELAAAMGNDPNFATTITNALAGKPGFADVWTRTQADARYVQGISQTENVFTGTGSQTTFALTQTPPTRESLLVTVDGVVQPTTAYNLSGSALILSEAPASGASIRVLMLGIAGPVQSASTLSFTQAGIGAVTQTVDSKLKDVISVKDFGAKGDGTTDDLAAFNAARNAAALSGKAIFIPETSRFYKLSARWEITSPSTRIYGEGVKSLLCIFNASGQSCIYLDGAPHVQIADIGITGIAGSGHGIEVANSSHRARVWNTWIGWVDGNAIHISGGISCRFYGVIIDQNNGYRPAQDNGPLGATEGNIKKGIYVTSHPFGLNNDARFIGCSIDAAAGAGAPGNYSLQVGDANGVVDSFSFTDGLIQGNGRFQEIYLRTKDAVIANSHVEPPNHDGSADSTNNYRVVLDGCSRTVFKNCSVQGDAQLLGACFQSGFESCLMAGVDISTASAECFVRDCSYRNIVVGPANGYIKDRGYNTEIARASNASNVNSTGNGLPPTAVKYFASSMQDWVGGASPTGPCGFIPGVGGITIARESTIKRTFDYSCKMTANSPGTLTRGIMISVLPFNAIDSKKVYAEAWIYNQSGTGYLTGWINGGALTVYEPTWKAGAWEKVRATFDLPSISNFYLSVMTDGVCYVDSFAVYTEGPFEHYTEGTLDGTATPELSRGGYGGYHIPTWITSGTPTVTSFLNPHVGKPFTIRFASGTTIQNNANIKLAGAASFVGTADDTLTLVYGSDGVFREICRSVN